MLLLIRKLSFQFISHSFVERSMGYAFVQFKTTQSAAKALRLLNGLCIHNKKLKVSYAKPNACQHVWASIYISGIPKDMQLDELNAIFASYGQILSSRILYQNSGMLFFFFFVNFILILLVLRLHSTSVSK